MAFKSNTQKDITQRHGQTEVLGTLDDKQCHYQLSEFASEMNSSLDKAEQYRADCMDELLIEYISAVSHEPSQIIIKC